jgi:hypothetical protein
VTIYIDPESYLGDLEPLQVFCFFSTKFFHQVFGPRAKGLFHFFLFHSCPFLGDYTNFFPSLYIRTIPKRIALKEEKSVGRNLIVTILKITINNIYTVYIYYGVGCGVWVGLRDPQRGVLPAI